MPVPMVLALILSLPKQFPLEHGLKRISNPQRDLGNCASKAISIRTWIETQQIAKTIYQYRRLPKQFPLEHGLKQVSGDAHSGLAIRLPKQFPLEHGLKRKDGERNNPVTNTSKAISIRTWIETCLCVACVCIRESLPKQFPLEHGLKPNGIFGDGRLAAVFQSNFH